MSNWLILTTSTSQIRVSAEYFKIEVEGRFIEFKDAEHKVVHLVAAQHVVSIQRDDE